MSAEILRRLWFYKFCFDGAACLLLVSLGVGMFAVGRGQQTGFVYVGQGADPEIFIWCLNWFWFAWVHHLPLMNTSFIAAPVGASLAWRTAIPYLSLLAAPVTMKYGALAAYNILMMLAPGLAGAGAYLAARELGGKWLPSLIAGLVFGFSSYEMGQSLGHLNLTFTVAVPLALFVYVRGIHKNWPYGVTGGLLGLLLAFQFGVSQEVCASFVIFALAAWLLFFKFHAELRPVLMRSTPSVMVGLGVAGLLSAPLLLPMIGEFASHTATIADPGQSSGDAVSFVVPTPVSYFFGHFFRFWTRSFAANSSEADGYVGLPLLVLLIYIYNTAKHDRFMRSLLLFAGLAALASLGPFIHVAGRAVFIGPWLPFSLLPVFKDMLPSRFMLYAWLAVALVLQRWLSAPGGAAKRYAAVLLALGFIVPNVSYDGHWSNLKIPEIFTANSQHKLVDGQNVLILPFVGNEIGDQYASNMKFRMIAQGYIGGGVSAPFSSWPLIMPLYNNQFSEIDPSELAVFLADYDAQQVLVIADELPNPQEAKNLLQKTGWIKSGTEGGVTVFAPPTLPPVNVAARAAAYQNQARMAVLQRRERLNVCVLRKIKQDTGIDLQPLYGRYFNLPLKPDGIICDHK